MNERIISNIKSLSIDMIHEAQSGHPGIALGAASIIYSLYANHLRVNPDDSDWINRDRFVLSAGHGSALLYSTLFMAGYNLYIDDLKRFRRINSKTPGHPEISTNGVDCNTGPLGQGIATAVGMAIASKKLNTMYKLLNNKSVIDYRVYVLCGDGDLMEGISNEAMSLAGNLCLNNLIVLYDSNSISLDGNTNMTFNESICAKYEAMGWHTEIINNEVKNIDKAIEKAKNSSKPTLIEVRTKIGEGSLLENTNKVHGKPLTFQDIEQLKEKLKINKEPFFVDMEAANEFRNKIKSRIKTYYDEWINSINEYNNSNDVKEFSIEDITSKISIDLSIYEWNFKNIESTRLSNHDIVQKLSSRLTRLIGGSADTASSTLAYLDDLGDIKKNDFTGRNIRYGVRENAMGAISNGLALSYFKPFCSCFLSFADYLKPSLRMTALMDLPVTYIFTHDSIFVGQDGPSHQPIEQISMLRSVPNMITLRPADAKEVVGCWNYILNNSKPVNLILSRTDLPLLDNSSILDVSKGAYIVRKEEKLHAIILATGSEVSTSIKIANELKTKGYDIRVVSVPSIELFEQQSDEYKEMIIPKMTKVFAIEASNYQGWYKYIYNEKYLININRFGVSGTKEEVEDALEFNYESIKNRIIKLL